MAIFGPTADGCGEPMTPCDRCGSKLSEQNASCPHCGLVPQGDSTGRLDPVHVWEELERNAHGPAAAIPAAPGLRPGRALVVVKSGRQAGSRYHLGDGETTLGREPDSEIFFDDITVSRAHARIARGERRYSIQDLGSLNGTFVNGIRIDNKELAHGDELQIGCFRLLFLSSWL